MSFIDLGVEAVGLGVRTLCFCSSIIFITSGIERFGALLVGVETLFLVIANLLLFPSWILFNLSNAFGNGVPPAGLEAIFLAFWFAFYFATAYLGAMLAFGVVGFAACGFGD